MRDVTKPRRLQSWQPCAERVVDGQAVLVYRWASSRVEAPVVVLIHGMEESWDIWTDFCERAAGQFHLFALDLPWHGRQGYTWGHGRSAPEWLRLGLELVPATPSGLIAHSFGANAALEYLHLPGSRGFQ